MKRYQLLLLGLSFGFSARAASSHEMAARAVRGFARGSRSSEIAQQIAEPLARAFDLENLSESRRIYQDEFLKLVPGWYQASGHNVVELEVTDPYSKDKLDLLAYVMTHQGLHGRSLYSVYLAHIDGRPLRRFPAAPEQQGLIHGEGYGSEEWIDNPIQQVTFALNQYFQDIARFKQNLLRAYRFVYMDLYQLAAPPIEAIMEKPFENGPLPYAGLYQEVQRLAALKTQKILAKFRQREHDKVQRLCNAAGKRGAAYEACALGATSILWAMSPHAWFLVNVQAPVWPMITIDNGPHHLSNPYLNRILEDDHISLKSPYGPSLDEPVGGSTVLIAKTVVPLVNQRSIKKMELLAFHKEVSSKVDFEIKLYDEFGRLLLARAGGHSMVDVLKAMSRAMRDANKAEGACTRLLVKPPSGKII